jgi:hypothetical protein
MTISWAVAVVRGLARLARRHWIFTGLLVLGLVMRILVMIAYQPAIFYVDSVASYLLPLPGLDPTGEDPIGYDLYLLAPVLHVANFTTVVAIQHLMGLGMAVAGYALLVHKGAWRVLAAVATVPVLLDGYQLQIEQNIMSEPLFEAMLVAALVTLTWRARPNATQVVVAGLLLGFSVSVRQAGELLFAPLIAYTLLAGGAWRHRLRMGATALVCFALPVGAYATFYFARAGNFAISHVGGNALYGRVATFADCDGLDIPADEQVLCPQVPRDLRPGPDYWAHDAASPYFVLQDRLPDQVDNLSKDFSLRIIRHQPLDWAAAIGSDATKVLSWNRIDHSPNDPTVERWHFQESVPLFPPLVSMDEITQLSHLYGDGDPVAVTPLAKFLRAYQLRGGYTPGPVLALSILLALAPLVRWRRAGPARLPALLFLATGVLVLLVGDLMIFSYRYQLPGYVLLPVAAGLGLAAVSGRRPAPATPAEPALAGHADAGRSDAGGALDPGTGPGAGADRGGLLAAEHDPVQD